MDLADQMPELEETKPSAPKIAKDFSETDPGTIHYYIDENGDDTNKERNKNKERN